MFNINISKIIAVQISFVAYSAILFTCIESVVDIPTFFNNKTVLFPLSHNIISYIHVVVKVKIYVWHKFYILRDSWH